MALIPEVAGKLVSSGVEVVVEQGAGAAAHFPDALYVEKGATVKPGARDVVAGAALIAKVQAPTPEEVATLPEGATVVSFLQPASQLDTVRALAERKATAFSLDLVPRISHAQSMDALSSQATVSGYLSALAGGRSPAQVLPYVHDRGAGPCPRQGARPRGRGGRIAGHRHGPAPRRPGARLQRAGRRQGRSAVAGRPFVELEAQVPGGGGRVRRAQSEEFLARRAAS